MYKALYSKYRPLTFDDVVSQPHITQTLMNQITGNKTAHAYLFTGSRGTGKTTCARILAKTINCEHSVNGNPCLECEICKDADANALSDIIEIDAASNNGVDDIRELREGAVYTPERCKYKVYIIDEVHMLSPSAFNALLKIMEEPPPHVKFILATTEVHKVLPTILSRCQRYDFRRILPEDIKNRLLYVAECENIKLDSDAAELIAKTADGGMRDALSLLDQCVAFSEDVTAEVVANAAGIAGREYLFEIIGAVTERNASKAVTVIKKLYEMSKDVQQLCDELIAQFRNIMMAKAVPGSDDVLVCMPAEIQQIKQLAEKLTAEEIFEKIDVLQHCRERLAKVPAKRVEIEMCLIRLCMGAVNTVNNANTIDNSEIYAKIDMLEKKLASGYNAAPVQQKTEYAPRNIPVNTAPAVNSSAPAEKAQNQGGKVDFKSLDPNGFRNVERWAEIFELFSETCPSVSGAMTGSYAVEQSGYMLISTDNPFFASLLKRKENAEKLQEAIFKVTGKSYIVRARCTAKEDGQGESPLQKLLDKAKESGIPSECN